MGVASPQTVESVSEKEEELPVAMDCTSLPLVDAVQGESASLFAENQVSGVEAIFPHKEDTCFAVLIAQNEKSLNSAMPAAGVAIANQKQGQLKQGISASLSGENQVFGVEVKAAQESESSAPPVSQTEKWSHEAINVNNQVL
nr:hypothetical protein [Nostoc sp. UIC 10630]